jgi:hypothetical protein
MAVQTRPETLPVWAESGDKTQPSNAEIQTGWPLSTIPPSRQRFNWAMNYFMRGVRYLLQFGIGEWDANETYPVGGKCFYGGLEYKALQAHSNQQPDLAPTYWERWGFTASQTSQQTGAVLTKSVAGNVDVALTATEASNGIIILTGALTGNINVTVPAVGRKWQFINNTTGAFTLKVKTPSGTGIFINQGALANLICDGTNVRSANGVKINAFTAVAGTAQTVDYNVGACIVTRNGSVVAFTGTNGTSITLAVAASAGDAMMAISF